MIPIYWNCPAEAAVARASLRFLDGPGYELLAHCPMLNHVHLVVHLSISNAAPLTRTLQRLKNHTAQKIRCLRDSDGRVWQRESYDYHIRNTRKMAAIITRALNNPVKAGLVKKW